MTSAQLASLNMNDVSQTPRWGFFVLVSYVPDPLGAFLNGLRCGQDIPQAHITILPRRPLLVPVEEASDYALKTLSGFPGFNVELSTVRRFRQSNFLYIGVSEGNSRLHALHDALNSGDLAYQEEYEFRPHLTLGGPSAGRQCDLAKQQAEAAWDSAPMPKRFFLDQLACLWLRPGATGDEWLRLWSHNLKTKQTTQTPMALSATNQTY